MEKTWQGSNVLYNSGVGSGVEDEGGAFSIGFQEAKSLPPPPTPYSKSSCAYDNYIPAMI